MKFYSLIHEWEISEMREDADGDYVLRKDCAKVLAEAVACIERNTNGAPKGGYTDRAYKKLQRLLKRIAPNGLALS